MISDAYLENRVMTATPEELVKMLYEAAIEAVGRARRHLKEGDIAARTRQITRAQAIYAELAASLNHEVAPQLARRLSELYDYMIRRLTDAQMHQDDAPLAEVSRLTATLLDGWLQTMPMAA